MTTPEEHGTHIPPARQTASAHSAAGMVRIGRSPVRSWAFVVATGLGALLLGAFTAGAISDSTWAFPISAAVWAVPVGGAIWACLAAYFRPVAFDPVAGLARLGRTTIPVASVIAAQRKLSAAATSVYLSYRFSASNGAWGRVLVAGRPMRGLRPEDVPLLERFVVASGIPDAPAPGPLPPAQRMAAEAIALQHVSDLNTHSSNRPVGKVEILAELRGEAPGPTAAEADLPPGSALHHQWAQDDRDADSVVLGSAADTARRVLGWVTVGFALSAMAVLAFAVIREETSGSLDSETNDLVVTLLLPAIALGLASYLGYAVAGLVGSQRAQRAVLTWLQHRDAQQVVRGLPPRLLAPFLGVPPEHRLRLAAGWAGSVIGGIGVLGGLVAIFLPDAPAVGAVVLLLVGAPLLWLGVAMFVRARRALRAQHQLAARLGGQRFVSGR